MNVLTDIEGVSISHIKIVKPINVNENIFFAIEYCNNPFIIQTPYMYVKYRPVTFENGYYKLDLEMCPEFTSFIKQIEIYIINKLAKKYSRNTTNFSYSNTLLRSRSMNYKSIGFYDKYGKTMDGARVCIGDRVSLLLYIDKYIYNKHKSYINYHILQVKTFSIDASSIATSDNSYDIDKYKKMLKIGVPLSGVKQKMMMDGLANDVIEKIAKTFGAPPLPPPPPPPPLPKPGITHKILPTDMSAVFGDIKNGNFQLKKIAKETPTTSKILRCVDTSRKVPSLAEIQNALKNLRRIN